MADEDAGTEAGEDRSAAVSEWRFPLSEFEDDGAGQDDSTADGEAVDGSGATDGPRERIEAGDPTLEGTFFLLLGVAVALFVISRLVVG